MEAKRLLLHAGEPKTGTTAIQILLRDNRATLKESGYLVPESGSSRIGNHTGLVNAILGRAVPPSYADCVDAFRREVAADSAHTVIVSAENLDYRFRNPDERERILRFMHDLGLAITVVMFIRPDAEAHCSLYAEQAKSFLFTCTMSEFALTRRRYVHLLELAATPGIQTIFRPYNAEVRRRGAAREFMRAIGFSDDAIDRFGPECRVNESIGPIALAASVEVRKRIEQSGRLPTDQQRQALKAELLRLTEQEEPEPPFYGVDADLLQKIEQRVAETRERFAQLAWGQTWHAVFGSTTKQSNAFNPATAEPADLERYQRLTDALWAAAERIMAEAKFAKVNPWDQLHSRVGCVLALAHLFAT